MRNYKNVTFLEYMQKKKAIMDSLGRSKDFCQGVSCDGCPFEDIDDCMGIEQDNPKKAIELIMDFDYPVDWSKVSVDTPIYVRNNEESGWHPKHFAKYEGGKVYAWSDGGTSFTTSCMRFWRFAKLKDPEV